VNKEGAGGGFVVVVDDLAAGTVSHARTSVPTGGGCCMVAEERSAFPSHYTPTYCSNFTSFMGIKLVSLKIRTDGPTDRPTGGTASQPNNAMLQYSGWSG
jgi:hypothetical protein